MPTQTRKNKKAKSVNRVRSCGGPHGYVRGPSGVMSAAKYNELVEARLTSQETQTLPVLMGMT
jgi:hypothetical protein